MQGPAALAPPTPVAPGAAVPPPAAPGPSAGLVDLAGKTDVALVLPLTGDNAAIGRDMLDAAQLALSDLAGDDMALTPKDTASTPAGAAEAARQAIAEGAKLIVGPLTAAEIDAVKPITGPAGISVLAFSNQAQEAGGGVFLLGFLPQQETKRVADYAKSTGIDHFAVLAPSTPYGQLTARSFQGDVRAAGGTVDDVEYFDPEAGDPRPAVQHLAADGKFTFTALLIPEPVTARLKNVASLLPVYDIDPPAVRVLGTDTWDVPNLGSEPALIGAWYAAPPPDARAGFQQRFKANFGHMPQRLATLAYDAVGVAVVLQRTPGAQFSAEALTNPSGFAGADGIFRLLPDGTAERGLAVLQVERSGATVVSPAPETFEAVGE